MTGSTHDPWTVWYESYLAHRAAIRVGRAAARDRQRATATMAALLVGYMLLGGAIAGVAVHLVMVN